MRWPGRTAGGLALLAAACAPPDPLAPTPGAPIVLISLDTLRADHLGCYGYDRPTSPHLDAFAREAVLFEHVVAPSNNTAPSHTSLMTGVLPPVHGIQHRQPAHPAAALEPLPRTLQRAGYRTLGLADGGFVTEPFGFARGFDRFESWFEPFERKLPVLARWLSEAREGPVFLFVHSYEAHAPYAPRDEHDLFTDAVYAGPLRRRAGLLRDVLEQAGTMQDMATLQSEFWAGRDQFDQADRSFVEALYDGDVHQADAGVGDLLALLAEVGWTERAWIVITSDHGEAFGEHGTWAHRQVHAEELGIPLLIRPPGGLPGGRRVSRSVSLIDVAPTLLRCVGLAPSGPMQGVSLLPLEGLADRPAYARGGEAVNLRALVQGRLKLIARRDGELQAYDLAADPGEREDLAAQGQPPAWSAALLQALRAVESDCERLRARAGEPVVGDELDEQQREALRALGYVGDEDDGPR